MGAIRLRSVPLFGTGTVSKSFVSTRQRRLNVYFEIREDKDKSRFAIFGTPGLTLLMQPSITTSAIRGMLGTPAALYVVGSNQFQAIQNLSTPPTTVNPGTPLTTTSGQVSLATNNTQVLVADGTQGMIYDVAANTFAPIGGAFPNKAQTLTFVSSFFVAENPGTQQFFVSEANDGSTWDSLAFASASAYPGTIQAVDNLSGNLIIFSTDHIEFWQDVGAAPEPFQPIVSGAREFGLAAVFSRAHVDESICFLAQNREGQVQIAQISNGYDLEIISTPDIDALINSFDMTSDAVALSYGVDAHKFYQITFPSANRTFIWDSSTAIWCEAQTGPSIVPTRHIGNLSTAFLGQIIISDYKTNNLYSLNPNVYTDNGAIIPRELITRHVLSDFNRIRVAALYLDMETGVGLQSGQGSNPQIMLSYSKDNGRTWSGERWASSGLIGHYQARVWWRRFGSTRDATFRIRMTDPVKFVITDAAMRLRENGRDPNRAQSQGRMQ
jgi:hypothetical protein